MIEGVRFLGRTVKKRGPCRSLDGHVITPTKRLYVVGARRNVKRLLQSSYTTNKQPNKETDNLRNDQDLDLSTPEIYFFLFSLTGKKQHLGSISLTGTSMMHCP